MNIYPEKSCLICEHIYNVGRKKDVWKCKRNVFYKIDDWGTDCMSYLVCPHFLMDKGLH